MKSICLIFFCAVILCCQGYTAILPNAEIKEFPGECYDPQTKIHFKPTEARQRPGFCEEMTCGKDLSIDYYGYPTTHQKMTLAMKIIETYPALKKTKLSEDSPDYIQKAYERLKPSYNKESNLKQVFARGLLVDRSIFYSCRDDNVRGCLHILVHLTRRGIWKSLKEDSTDIEQELAAPIIRCITDTETALEEQLARYVAWNVDADVDVAPHLIFNGKNYFLYVESQIIPCGSDSIRALDTLFKAFSVFNIRPPATVQKMLDFVEIMCYNIKTTSTRQMVNRLVSSFRESINADGSDSED